MTHSAIAPRSAALIGMISLATAMGIGRFAFTPIFPLMQQHFGTDLAEGGWLASANYLGYFAGAIFCTLRRPPPGRAARLGLGAVAAFTLAMGMIAAFVPWLVLRFLAGIASALVLIGTSSWALPIFAASGKSYWSGFMFAGVGIGITIAGVVGLAGGFAALDPGALWLLLGGLAFLAAGYVWEPMKNEPAPARNDGGAAAPLFSGEAWRLALCYGAFGFGYILPATFLPAFAREIFPDPLVFGSVWPIFGLAAALSTLMGAALFGRFGFRGVWAGAQCVMAVGILVPMIYRDLWALILSALAVGGTFMVITMAGLQEARRIAGPASPRLIAFMTATFAAGQILGPLAISFAKIAGLPVELPGILAAGLTLAGAAALIVFPVRMPQSSSLPGGSR